ncbi:CHAT domain-containing protein [Streptosporangiaceae bacterium NEAU-GS5]|nr:CHAT domain-containing protein [Streptosporangiaceae bacterium NEAU-GS5]
MGGESEAGSPVPDDPHAVLAMAFARPRQAMAVAQAMLAARPGPYAASLARQTLGILYREFGDLDAAIAQLRQAVRLARRAGSADREADVLATLGIALVHRSRATAGLKALDAGVARSDGVTWARVLFRRGGALWILGRHREALDDLERSIAALVAAGDTVWAARAITIRGNVLLALGSVGLAGADFATAQRMFATTDQEHDSVVAIQNQGLVAFRTGDLPAALAKFDEADLRFKELGTPMFDLVADRCAVLLAAGLARDALEHADFALDYLARLRGQATRRAELLLVAARAALIAGDPAVAGERARQAHALFARQGRAWWAAHARLILVQADATRLTPSPALLGRALRLTDQLAAQGSPDLWQAHLLAGRMALALRRTAVAERHLSAAAEARHRGPALSRVGGWLAEALRADAAGRSRRLLHACRKGLALVEEHRLTLGSAELRALATAHAAELATLAQRRHLRSGRPRVLLEWTERWRATALAAPAVRPPDDRDLVAALAALRETDALLSRARARGTTAGTLDRERQRLEREIRARTLRLEGAGPYTGQGLDCGRLLAALGDGRLIELTVIDGVLHALLCGGGQVRRFEIGPVSDALSEIEFARSRLRRLAYVSGAGAHGLDRLGARLEAAVLGPAAATLGDGPVVVVPPGILHGTPWALLPALRRRVFSVAPSARAWLRARAAERPGNDEVVLVRGPGLLNSEEEVRSIAALYETTTVLQDGSATAPDVLAALDGCALAHVVAHGTFRADSPLFSALHLDDGPLTVYDLQRLRRAPYRLILSSCDSAQLAAVGVDEFLGLAAALLPLGTAGIVASVVPVNDADVVPLMTALHAGLRRGHSLARALRDSRGADVTFIAIGAG